MVVGLGEAVLDAGDAGGGAVDAVADLPDDAAVEGGEEEEEGEEFEGGTHGGMMQDGEGNGKGAVGGRGFTTDDTDGMRIRSDLGSVAVHGRDAHATGRLLRFAAIAALARVRAAVAENHAGDSDGNSGALHLGVVGFL